MFLQMQRSKFRSLSWLVILITVLLLSSCAQTAESEKTPRVEITRIYITATPEPTQTASPTPTQTPTPSPTSTPTPTAPAIMVLGNPRGYTLFDPQPQSGAPCGWVDTLDFPLDPPDGTSASGGRDFGVYRSRYEKYHAGEDWRLSNRNNFGQPVYSIGHGQVTYAQPLGWGADKGVVIVRHTFPDGSSVLSFYGHLDPPSVTLREGTCVQRGDIVGQIGRPRTPPHLHFEVRLHLPYATGGGYWPSDPTNAGWLPPSDTISQYRLQVAPGVEWSHVSNAEDIRPLGNLDTLTYLMLDGDHLVGIDLFSGEQRWAYKLPGFVKDALFDPVRKALYITDVVAGLQAYAVPRNPEDQDDPEELTPQWEQPLTSSGWMSLMPLPGGGVVASHRDTISAFAPDGELRWEEPWESYLSAWALSDDALIFISSDDDAPLKTADAEGVYSWAQPLSGIPLVSGGQAWLYAEDGLYQLDLFSRSARRVYDLPTAIMRQSAAIALEDGGILLLHTDSADRRLLLFDRDGNLLWEFSVPFEGTPQLIELGGEPYLISIPSYSSRGAYSALEVFAIDPEKQQLFRVFQEGSRVFNPRSSWMTGVGEDQLLIHIAGISVLFDPERALVRMGQ
jgi:murein DD-endopeptidase MepM/ murein hydrolase activator NlpD